MGEQDPLARYRTLRDRLRQGLADDGWRILNRTRLPIVCFDDPAVSPERSATHLRSIIDEIAATGRSGSRW